MSAAPAPVQTAAVSARRAGKPNLGRLGVRLLVGIVIAALIGLLGYPIGRMVASALFPAGRADLSAFSDTVSQPWFFPVIKDTILVVGVSAVIALLAASLLAWVNERTDAGLGWLGTVMPLLPLFVPPIAAAAGWVFLATPKVGFLNGLLALLPGSLSVNVLTVPGLIFVYVLELIPFAYIPIAGALRNVDPALEEASRVSGAGLLRTVFRVSLPAVSQAIMAAFFLLVVVGFALYSAPVVVGTNAGIDILSVRVVRLMQFTYPADLRSATVLSTMLLIVVGLAWLLQSVVTGRGRYAMITGRGSSAKVPLGRLRHVLRAGTIGYLAVSVGLPLFALVVVAMQPYWTTTINPAQFNLEHFEEVLTRRKSVAAIENSILIGAVGAAVAVGLCVVINVARRRTSHGRILGPRASRVVDGVTRLPSAFSAIVIALGFIVAFSGAPFALSGTMIILGLCYVVNFLPQAAANTSTAMSQIADDMTDASYLSQAGEARTLTSVTLPLALPGLLSTWALLFVLIAGEIAASTMLAGARTPVIGFVLVETWENGTVGPMAAFACIVTMTTAAIAIVILLLGRQRYRRTG